MEAFKNDCSPSISANVQEVKHCPRPPDWRKGPFGRRGWGKLLISIKPVDFISFAQHLFWEMHRKPFTCGLDDQPDHQLEVDLHREGRAVCPPLQSPKCHRSATACSLESWAGSTKVCEPSQDGAGPPTLLFLFLPARKGVGKMKRLEAQR